MIYGGKCGDNLTWSINESEGELIIEGTGPMYDYADANSLPWSNSNYFKKLTIKPGITHIGNYAFYPLGNSYGGPDYLEIPDTVESIGNHAFYNARISRIKVPDSVTSIGEYAFNSSYIYVIELGTAVDTLGNYALYNVKFIIFNGDKPNTIGANVVYNSGSSINSGTPVVVTSGWGEYSVFYPGSNNIGIWFLTHNFGDNITWDFDIKDGVLTISGTGDINIPNNGSFESTYSPFSRLGASEYSDNRYQINKLVFGEGITSIPQSYSFKRVPVKSIEFPSTLLTIGSYAFSSCNSLQQIIFKGPKPTFGTEVFEDVYNNSDYPIIISCQGDWGTINIFYPLFSDTPTTFYGCIFDENMKCGENISMHYDPVENVIELTGTGAMYDFLLSWTTNSKTAKNIPWKKIAKNYSYNSNSYDSSRPVSRAPKLVIGEGITEIGSYAFYNCHFREMEVPNNLISIHSSAFESMTVYSDVDFGEQPELTVESLGFRGCGIKGKVTFNTGPKEIVGYPGSSSSEGAFYQSNIEHLILGEGLSEIEKYAFNSCQIPKIKLPSGVKTIGEYAFHDSAINEIFLPEGLDTIGQYAFQLGELKSLILPFTLRSIGGNAFGSIRGTQSLCVVFRRDALLSNVPATTDTLLVPKLRTSDHTYPGAYIRTEYGWLKLDNIDYADDI